MASIPPFGYKNLFFSTIINCQIDYSYGFQRNIYIYILSGVHHIPKILEWQRNRVRQYKLNFRFPVYINYSKMI